MIFIWSLSATALDDDWKGNWFLPIPGLCFFILVDVLSHGGFAFRPKQSSRETVAKISMPMNSRNAEMKVLHDNNEFVN